jgi:hypothetical protein
VIRTALAPALAVVAIALAGCGDGSLQDEVGEGVSETGPTFEDTITIPTTPEGEIDPASTTTVGVEDVEVTPDEFPDGWPEEFPVPEDARVEQGAVTLAPGEERLVADLTIPEGMAQQVLEFYQDELRPPDFEILSDEGGEQGVVQVTFRTDDYLGNVLATDEDDGVTLTLQVTRPRG